MTAENPATLDPVRGLRRAWASPRRAASRRAVPQPMRDATALSGKWMECESLLFSLQNFLQRVLLFLIHGKQLVAQLRIRWIYSRLCAQIGDRAIQYNQFLVIVGKQRRRGTFELRLGLLGELVDRLRVGGFRTLDFLESLAPQQ